MPLRVPALTAIALGAVVVFAPSLVAPVQHGASAAPARTYTRKKVNGRWVTGSFSTRKAVRGQARHRLASRAASTARSVPEEAVPVPPLRPSELSAAAETSSLTPAGPSPRIERMRPALEAHARTLASRIGPEKAAPPRSVTFDFETGVKTVVYGDGVARSEPFDRTRTGEIAGRSPATP